MSTLGDDALGERFHRLSNTIGDAAAELMTLAAEASARLAPPCGVDDVDLRACARRLHEERRLRERFFGCGLFSEPGWDMLLDVYIAETEGKRLTATAACAGSDVALTTGLRWLRVLERGGLLERVADGSDRRCQYVVMRPEGRQAMRLYLTGVLQLRLRSSRSFASAVPSKVPQPDRV